MEAVPVRGLRTRQLDGSSRICEKVRQRGNPDPFEGLGLDESALDMDFLSNPLAARALWLAPLLMLVIAIALVPAGFAQREAAEAGETVQAEVLGVNLRERSEITRGEAVLRYTPPGASSSVERSVEMPLVLLKDLQVDFEDLRDGETMTVPIRVSESSDQIVLGAHSRAQWILTFSFAAMALIGAIGLAILVRGWNRLLRTQGDPARRPHPAAS